MSSSPSGTFAAIQPSVRTAHHVNNIEESLRSVHTALEECRRRTRETRELLQRMNERSWGAER